MNRAPAFDVGAGLADRTLATLEQTTSLHPLILVEEERLRHVSGGRYAAFCDQVPSYAGWGRLRIKPAVL